MKTERRTLDEIRNIGLEALSKALGPVDTIRFLQQFETGSGDYSVERHQWLTFATVQEAVEALHQRRAGANREEADR